VTLISGFLAIAMVAVAVTFGVLRWIADTEEQRR